MPARTEVHPATAARWLDVERLFGPRGAYGSCWCGYWRLPRAQWQKMSGAQRKANLRAAVEADEAPGLLAYRGGEPVGWIAVQPREAYRALDRSPLTKGRRDEEGVWSVTCFFIHPDHRRSGLMTTLLKAAVAHARDHGAAAVEGYPYEPDKIEGASGYMGLRSAFEAAGFREIARPAARRALMRRAFRQAGERAGSTR